MGQRGLHHVVEAGGGDQGQRERLKLGDPRGRALGGQPRRLLDAQEVLALRRLALGDRAEHDDQAAHAGFSPRGSGVVLASTSSVSRRSG